LRETSRAAPPDNGKVGSQPFSFKTWYRLAAVGQKAVTINAVVGV